MDNSQRLTFENRIACVVGPMDRHIQTMYTNIHDHGKVPILNKLGFARVTSMIPHILFCIHNKITYSKFHDDHWSL